MKISLGVGLVSGLVLAVGVLAPPEAIPFGVGTMVLVQIAALIGAATSAVMFVRHLGAGSAPPVLPANTFAYLDEPPVDERLGDEPLSDELLGDEPPARTPRADEATDVEPPDEEPLEGRPIQDPFADPGRPVLASKPSPVTPTVVDELERLAGPKGSIKQATVVLGITVMLFVGAEATMEGSLTFILHLVLVIAFHEAGHFVAMKAMGYRDLRVFFIPFLGAGVSGANETATGTQRAVVSLAGPLPGIVLAIILVIGNAAGSWAVDEDLVNLMIGLNMLNLLPFEPLDGGRFLQVVLFQRIGWAEGAMRFVGVIVMLGAAISFGDWFLGVFALFFAIGLGRAARMREAAKTLRAELPDSAFTTGTIPEAHRERVGHLTAEKVLVGTDVYSQPNELAAGMHELWARALLRPPGIAASVGLMAVYLLFTLVLGFGAVVG